MEMEHWQETESQYDLIRLQTGSLVRSPNHANPLRTPLHWLCENCFGNKKKSVLQRKGIEHSQPLYCPECRIEIHLGLKDHDLYFSEAQNNVS
jgi:hypothetical protein